MLYIFKSQAAQDLVMLEADAKVALQLIGKSISGPGIITPEQLPDAIASLRRVVDEDRIKRSNEPERDIQPSDALDESDPRIYLSQKLIPLLKMLHLAKEAGKAVIWSEGDGRRG